jgi:hypothetical protein
VDQRALLKGTIGHGEITATLTEQRYSRSSSRVVAFCRASGRSPQRSSDCSSLAYPYITQLKKLDVLEEDLAGVIVD